MANQQPGQLGYQEINTDRAFQQPNLVQLPPANAGRVAASMQNIGSKLAAKFGALADRAALIEGTAAGRKAGMDPNYKPTGDMTASGRASDEAATQVYGSNLTTRLQADMQGAYLANKNDPVAFKAAAEQIRATYAANHLFPDIEPEFNKRWADLTTAYTGQATTNFQGVQENQNRASLQSNLANAETTRGQLIAGSGNDPASRQAVEDSLNDSLQQVDALVGKGLDPTQALTLKTKLKQSTYSSLAVAGASKLTTPEAIENYRSNLKADFVQGKSDLDYDTWQKIDNSLQTFAQATQTGQRATLADVQKQVDSMAERQAKGLTVSVAEMTGIAAEANSAGPEGQAIWRNAQEKFDTTAYLKTLPPSQQQAALDAMKNHARATTPLLGADVSTFPPGTFGPGGGMFTVPKSADWEGVAPQMRDIMQAAAEQSGLRVQVTPAGGRNSRSTGTDNHPEGWATDVQLLDSDGKPLGNYQDATTFRAYEKFAQIARQIQQQKYPELDKQFRWGGYFTGSHPGDQMHFDMNPHMGGMMAGGDWDNGLNDKGQAVYGGRAQSQGLKGVAAVAAAGAAPGDIIRQVAQQTGADPEQLATIISYESGFDTGKWGGKDNKYLGLIQFGPAEQVKYKIRPGMSFAEQMVAVGQFIKDRGFKPSGDPQTDMLNLYSTINAGSPGHFNASDGNGTVTQHVLRMQAANVGRARAILNGGAGVTMPSSTGGPPNAVATSMPGMSPTQAANFEFYQKTIDATQKQIKEDPLGWASTMGYIAAITPYDPNSADAVQQLQARLSQVDAVSQRTQTAPTYLRPEEKTGLSRAFAEGGDAAMALAQQIVDGAGNKAGAIFKELGTDSPVTAQIGQVLANNGSAQAARDAFEAMKTKKEGGDVPTAPAGALDLVKDAIGPALADNPTMRNSIMQMAAMTYGARAIRNNWASGVQDDAANDAYTRSLQEAAGATYLSNEVGSDYRGGVHDWQPANGDPVKILLPSDFTGGQFHDAVGGLTEQDLYQLPVPPTKTADGKVYRADDFLGAIPQLTAGGYKFFVNDVQTGTQRYINGADGRPFVVPIDTLRAIKIAQQAGRPNG